MKPLITYLVAIFTVILMMTVKVDAEQPETIVSQGFFAAARLWPPEAQTHLDFSDDLTDSFQVEAFQTLSESKPLRLSPETEAWLGAYCWRKQLEVPDANAYSLDELAWLHSHKTIRIAGQRYQAPFFFRREDGNYAGIAFDYLTLITCKLGLQLEIVTLEDDGAAEEALQKGKADLLPAVCSEPSITSTPYLTHPYATMAPFIFIRNDTAGVYSLDDLAHKPVAINADALTESLRTSYPDIQFKPVADLQEALQRLIRGEVEALIGDLDQTFYHIRRFSLVGLKAVRPLPFEPPAVYLGIRPDWLAFKTLVQKTVESVTPEERAAVKDRWIHQIGESSLRETGLVMLNLNAGEQAWLKQHKRVRVWIDNQPPYQYFDQGRPCGIAVEYIKHILLQLELQPEFIPSSPDVPLKAGLPEAILQTGQADLVLTVIISSPGIHDIEAVPSPYITTTAYLTCRPVICTPAEDNFNGSFSDLAGKIVTVRPSQRQFLKNVDGIKIMPVKSLKKALDMVSQGKADACVGDMRSCGLMLEQEGLAHLKITDPIQNRDWPVAMAVRSDWPELSALIDKALKNISFEKRRVFLQSVPPLRLEHGVDRILFWRMVTAAAVLILLLPFFSLIKKLFTIRKRHIRDKTLEDLRDREAKLREMVENTNAYLYTFTKEGLLTYVSPSVIAASGKTRSSLVGHHLNALMPAQDAERVTKEVNRPTEGGRPMRPLKSLEIRLKVSDASYRWLSASTALIKEEGARPGYAVSVATDITVWKELEDRLFKALIAAERAGQAKATFVSEMSNEINTLLNNLLNTTEAVRNSQLPPGLHEYVSEINAAVRSLLTITHAIMDVTNVKVDKLKMRLRSFRLDDVLKELATMTAPKAFRKNLALIIDFDPRTPKELVGDPLRLKQILLNLIHNAIKYTARGEVSLTVRPNEMDDRHLVLQFDIQDSGKGFTSETLKKIERLFNQGTSIDLKKYSGIGIGLALCKNLAAMMQGRLHVESRPGAGSTFSLNMPFGRQTADDKALVNIPDDLKHSRILLVGGNPKAQVVMKSFLDAHDFHVNLQTPDSPLTENNTSTYALIIYDLGKLEKEEIEVFRRFWQNAPWDDSTRLMAMCESFLIEADAKYDTIPGDIPIDGWILKPVLPWDLLGDILLTMTQGVGSKLPDLTLKEILSSAKSYDCKPQASTVSVAGIEAYDRFPGNELIVDWEDSYDDWQTNQPPKADKLQNTFFQEKVLVEGDQPIKWEEQLEALDQDDILIEPFEEEASGNNHPDDQLLDAHAADPEAQKLRKVLEAIEIVKEIEHEVIAARRNRKEKHE